MRASKKNGLVVVVVVLIVGKGGRGGDWAFIHCRGGWGTTGDEPPSLRRLLVRWLPRDHRAGTLGSSTLQASSLGCLHDIHPSRS